VQQALVVGHCHRDGVTPDADEPTGYDRAVSDEFSALVNARLDEARMLLAEASDSRPLCRIDVGAGPRVEAIKFRE
jgi:hypothetical protein